MDEQIFKNCSEIVVFLKNLKTANELLQDEIIHLSSKYEKCFREMISLDDRINRANLKKNSVRTSKENVTRDKDNSSKDSKKPLPKFLRALTGLKKVFSKADKTKTRKAQKNGMKFLCDK